MKRRLLKQLETWRTKKNRKPLILKGVRQCGKTYLLEQFGKQGFNRYHIINLEQQKSARALFQEDLDPARIIDELQFYINNPIDINNDLVIFDEIQACPEALTSLKYFCEDLPELALCSAGSLLGLHLSEGSYPVGKVDTMHLYPMTFSEFLSGIGDDLAAEYFSTIDLSSNISSVVHDRFWKRLKHYFITGGLPEVVSVFTENQNNLYEASKLVRLKQAELIKAYYADIAKHAGKVNAMHIDRTWHAVPKQLSETIDGQANRFKFKGIIPGINRYSRLVNVIDWLEATDLVINIPVINTIRQPLSAYTKINMFKLLMFDVGLLGAMSGLDPKTILDYNFGSYKGYFAENFVAQQLIASNHPKMFNWHEGIHEVEFILQYEGEAYPIEVKSGKRVKAKSLKNYIQKYHPPKSFILSANNIKHNSKSNVLHLPLYLTEKLKDFI